MMFRYVPGARRAFGTSYWPWKSSRMSPALKPALSAVWFASTRSGLPSNFSAIHSSVGSSGRLYTQYIRPRV